MGFRLNAAMCPTHKFHWQNQIAKNYVWDTLMEYEQFSQCTHSKNAEIRKARFSRRMLPDKLISWEDKIQGTSFPRSKPEKPLFPKRLLSE